jgi:probable F420-dependent oxidoreductase
VRVGIIFSQADSGTDPAAIRSWVQEAEAAGFEHVLAYDHVLGASAERLGEGPFGPFPNAPYTNADTFHEILTLFSHLSGATTTISFVTSVLVLPQRQVALVAKQLATLDLLSAGRIRVAVGAGWNRAEYEGMGVDYSDRTALLEEQVEVMRRLWTEPLVTFEGRFHRLDRVGLTPLPGRALPIMLGTRGTEAALRRVVRIADGWMPLMIPGLDPMVLGDTVGRLRNMCEQAGRDPASLPIHGRVYLGDGWQGQVEDALDLGFADLSVGFNRLAAPGAGHRAHLDAVLEVKPELDRLVGRA